MAKAAIGSPADVTQTNVSLFCIKKPPYVLYRWWGGESRKNKLTRPRNPPWFTKASHLIRRRNIRSCRLLSWIREFPRILQKSRRALRLRCVSCGANFPNRRVPLPKIPPHCACGGLARPGVVWFGEPLPEGIMNEAEHAVSSAQVFLVIGTSAVVHPAAGLIPFAQQAGAKVIEINMDETPYSATVDCALRGPAGELLPQLVV